MRADWRESMPPVEVGEKVENAKQEHVTVPPLVVLTIRTGGRLD